MYENAKCAPKTIIQIDTKNEIGTTSDHRFYLGLKFYDFIYMYRKEAYGGGNVDRSVAMKIVINEANNFKHEFGKLDYVSRDVAFRRSMPTEISEQVKTIISLLLNTKCVESNSRP